MKSPFVKIRPLKVEPKPPQPTPFPIRIVPSIEPQMGSFSDDNVSRAEPTHQKMQRSDYFYDAWDKFLCQLPNRKSTAAKKIDNEKETVKKTPGDGLQVEENAFSSWEQAANECKAKVAAIVEECTRLNQKYRDAMFELDTDGYCLRTLDGRDPKSTESLEPPAEYVHNRKDSYFEDGIKRVGDIFEKPQFFIDGAGANDVHQGNGGNCWFLAALMAISAKKKELIEETLCVARDENVGVYGFVFFRDGEWIYEVIDDKLYLSIGDADDLQLVKEWDRDRKYGTAVKHDEEQLRASLQRGGEALYFSHCKSDETWVPLIEKAYAKAHGDYTSIEGGFTSEGIEDLTGGVGCVLHPEDIMDKGRFWREQLSQVNEKYLFGGGSKSEAAKGVVGSHAYAVLEAWEEGDLKLLKLRNPWGEGEWEGDWSDGSANWTVEMMQKLKHTFGDDGIFWISYEDFLKRFQAINRVRLFSTEWQVAQCWTCVNVPWAVDYLDTKFQFTITAKCSTVIVLSQPDDRYFLPLRGRYLYSLHFRVYKEGDTSGKWMVRSMHNSGNETSYTRSVSAEIDDLKPGTYNVVFKVTAFRASAGTPAESVIMKHAIDRKEKLLAVGRRFDYAHSKANLRAFEEANKKNERHERREIRKTLLKKERQYNQQEKDKERRRKKRIDKAMREKRRAFQDIQKEKAKLRMERREQWRRIARAEDHTEDRSDLPDEPGRGSRETQAEDCPEEKSDSKNEDTPETHESQEDTKNEPLANGEAASEPTPSKEIGQETEDDGEKNDTDFKALSKGVSEIDLSQNGASSKRAATPPPDHGYSDEDDSDSPVEPPEELDDNDFNWDSEIDAPVDSSDDDDGTPTIRAAASKNAIFSDDPWNAMCVLGLRVYSQGAIAKVSVIKGKNSS